MVLGYASKANDEVNFAFCQQNTIPVLRRCTGGGTVLEGPGCLNYSVILRIDESGLGHAILLDQAFTDAEYSKHTAACAGIGAAYPRLTGHGASPSLPFALGAFKWLANSSRRTFSSASTR